MGLPKIEIGKILGQEFQDRRIMFTSAFWQLVDIAMEDAIDQYLWFGTPENPIL